MEIDPDGVTTLFAYNATGELEYQAIDVNQDGQINLKGQDRVTRTVREYGQRNGLTVERVSTYEWPTLNDDKPDLVSVRETTLNGQRFAQTWETRHGLTSTSRTDLPGNGQKTVTTTAADGVKSISQYASGLLLSSSRYDAKGKLLGKRRQRNTTSSVAPRNSPMPMALWCGRNIIRRARSKQRMAREPTRLNTHTMARAE